MNLALWLERAGRAQPTASAIGYGNKLYANYAQLAERAARIAGSLSAFGLVPGDRVAVVARNHPDYIAILFGIWHAGLAAVPANARLHGAELGFILENSGARVCFASRELDAAITAHAPRSLERLIVIGGADYERMIRADAIALTPRAGDDLAWLFYTSGTTGRPKGAILTHRNLNWAAHAYLSEVDTTEPGDCILHAAPLSHGTGIYILPHVARMGINIVPESGAFETEEIFRLFDRWKRASMFAAPTMIKRLVEAPGDFNTANLRTLVWGGAPMYVEDVKRALDRFGPRLAQIYGQGESPMTITTLSKQDIAARGHPRWLERVGSAGRPFACLEVKTGDPEGRSLPTGEIGEIMCRGEVVMAGYWQSPDATTNAFCDGWLRTGDMGAFDEDGYLSLKDRSKDLIISGGSNIYPREVEEILLLDERVRDVSVVGRPDKDWGEIVVAYVVGNVRPEELDQLCLAHIARFKRPKQYVFVDKLPKNNYGKILKTELRRLDAERNENIDG